MADRQGAPAARRPGSPPGALLAASVAASGLGAWLILAGHPRPAGAAVFASTLCLLAGAAAARRAHLRRAIFGELLVDRVFDAAVLVPVAWTARANEPLIALLALVGLGASFVASYERARGRSLGYGGTEALGYRATRAVLLAVGLATGWLRPALWAFAALSAAAAAARAANVSRRERRASRARP